MAAGNGGAEQRLGLPTTLPNDAEHPAPAANYPNMNQMSLDSPDELHIANTDGLDCSETFYNSVFEIEEKYPSAVWQREQPSRKRTYHDSGMSYEEESSSMGSEGFESIGTDYDQDKYYEPAAKTSTANNLSNEDLSRELAKYFSSKVQTTVHKESPHVSLEMVNKPRQIQRPKYPKDGCRGCVKGENGQPASFRMQLRGQRRPMAYVMVAFLAADETLAPAKHFELYILPEHKKSSVHTANFGGVKSVAIVEFLPESEATMTFEAIGVRRNDVASKKLEKSCHLTCMLAVLEFNPRTGWLLNHTTEPTTYEIICEQPVGRPSIKEASVGRHGSFIVLKGSNFLPRDGKPRVEFHVFSHHKQILAETHDTMTKEMIVVYTPVMHLLEPTMNCIKTPKTLDVGLTVEVDKKRSEVYKLSLPASSVTGESAQENMANLFADDTKPDIGRHAERHYAGSGTLYANFDANLVTPQLPAANNVAGGHVWKQTYWPQRAPELQEVERLLNPTS